MTLVDIDRYIWEAEAHANELLEWIPHDERELVLLPWLRTHWPDLLPTLLNPPKTAFVFLGEDPADQARRAAALSPDQFRLLWVQARFLALRSASALRLVKDVWPGPRWKYRRAVRHAAQVVTGCPPTPGPHQVAMQQLPG